MTLVSKCSSVFNPTMQSGAVFCIVLYSAQTGGGQQCYCVFCKVLNSRGHCNNGDDGQQETASISNLYLVSRIPITDIRALCPFQLDALPSYASTQRSDPAK